ncbi:MAG: patatin-like phospholipase family protein [Candidatus Marinimicrobia bacterium]|nr:patatin-like phospholipase family protein [Candidatus Neomarinimicrobiota bacterium]
MEYDLVFEGGGAKGIVFVGAMEEFARQGHSARRYIGTSAGAITATLLAAGYSADELSAAATEKLPNGDPIFSSFMDTPEEFDRGVIEASVTFEIFKRVKLSWVPKKTKRWFDLRLFKRLMRIKAYRTIFSFIERGGLYKGDAFLDWIIEKLNVKNDRWGKATLSQFFEATGSDLTLVASDTTGKEMLVLNHRTAPDCPVAWAVRMSMSIPFLWQEVRWDDEWGTYLGRSMSDHRIVDGGVLSNFSIDLIISSDADVQKLMGGDTEPEGAGSLGLLIDENLEVPESGDAPSSGSDNSDKNLMDTIQNLRTVRRIERLIDTMTGAHDKLAIRAYEKHVCHLPAKGYGTTEFGMTSSRIDALIKAGSKAMREYFDNLNAG